MKAAIYARESSDDTNKAPDIQSQIDRAKTWIKEQGYELTKIYEDNGFSGGNWNRPAWNQIIKDGKFHKFNIVVVWNIDRIARDTEQFLWFQRNLKDAHIKLYSLCEGIINLDSVGDTAKNISLAMASEIFRKVTSDKVRRAYSGKLKEAQKTGERINWGRKPKEYDIDKIKELRSKGLGYKAIAKEIGGLSYQTVRRLLQNPPTQNQVNSEGNKAK